MVLIMKCYSKGAHLYSEHVFMGMQAISSRKNTLCCVICMTHIGGWEKQVSTSADDRVVSSFYNRQIL